jgi:uncharacterized protein (TIGR00369 family)
MLVDKELYTNIIEQLIPLHVLLNFKLEEIREGYAKIRVPFREELIGDPVRRALHGGIIATAMDSVGGAAGMTTLTSFEDRLSTIDMRVDYLMPGKAEDLFVEGQIVRSGNRIIVVRMVAHHGDAENLIADGKGVYNVKRVHHKSTNSL